MKRTFLISVLLACTAGFRLQAEPIDFEKQIQPLLTRHCYSCHGKDKQRGDLRLDRKADAIQGGSSGLAIVAGKSQASPLWQRIVARDDTRMPPKGDPLTDQEAATIRQWIDEGAKWPEDGSSKLNPLDWWSFRPIQRPALPAGASAIDHWIVQKLQKKGLRPNPEADRRTLIRRVYFDLLGLPPPPAEVDAFVQDPDRGAYEKLVDRLLASPHFGERWARHWLDIVHFGETHGYDKDQPRPNAWPYRDYVIRAFNSDKPYDRFIQEQVAGDMLFPGTLDGIEALGFLAAGPWDLIGHAEVPETKIDGKIARHLDRDDFVANTIGTFVGLTIHCAQCHNHKFDPIPQEDYYRLQAVFSAIDRTNRTYDLDPQVAQRRAMLNQRIEETATLKQRLLSLARQRSAGEITRIEQQLADAQRPNRGKPPEYGYHSALSDQANRLKWVQIDLGESIAIAQVILRACHDEFNNIGAGFGFPVRFRVEISDDSTFGKAHVIADHTTRDVTNPGLTPMKLEAGGARGRYLRLTATQLALRQNDYMLALAEMEAIDSSGKNRAQGKSVTALDSIEAPVRWRKSNLTDGLYPPEPKQSSETVDKLRKQLQGVLEATLGETDYLRYKKADEQMVAAEKERDALQGQTRTAYIGAVHRGSGTFLGTGHQEGKPRSIFLLPRGDVTRPGREVTPGAIRSIPGVNGDFALPAAHQEGDRRVALARWLSDRNNPFTWRVMANRVWQYHFGRGLVDTPNDFGKMGQQPSHPELLDYLAAELRDHQSLKRLHRQILLSATYRQASDTRPEFAQIDSENRELWRQNRRKLEAEAVRDAILDVAGKLDRTMGGPSFKDFVIEKPEHSPHYQYHLHDPEDPKSHRRAIYRFIVRSKQQPFMASLDCADPSLAVDKRNESISPQQALSMLNNRLATAMARHFATRVTALGKTDRERLQQAYRLALGRLPTENEEKIMGDYTRQHGLENACRVILNLNEFVFVD